MKFPDSKFLEEYNIYIFDGHSKKKGWPFFSSKNQQKHKTHGF